MLGISQLNQTYLIAGLDSKFIFCNNDEILLLIFCSVVDMFRDAPAGAYLVIVEDLLADPPAEPRRQAVPAVQAVLQPQQAPEGGPRNPCVICLHEEAIYITLFCCHVLACAGCVQALRANGIGRCPICREPAIYFLRIYFV